MAGQKKKKKNEKMRKKCPTWNKWLLWSDENWVMVHYKSANLRKIFLAILLLYCCCSKLKNQFLIFGCTILVTWSVGPKFGTPLALVETYIVWKCQLSTSSCFGVIRKSVKTWTHLPEKSLNKNKGTHARAQLLAHNNPGKNLDLDLRL